jgi:hypothetical protein
VQIRRVHGTSDLRLGEAEQVGLLSLEMVVDWHEIRVQASDVREVHFKGEDVLPL